MAGHARVTLADVAEASGVSRSTVSFVLNDRSDQTISAPTRERVLAAARDLGYSPHGIARALREGSSRIVVVIVRRGLDTNYARSFIRGLDDELRGHDHVALVRQGDEESVDATTMLDTIMPRAVLDIGGNYLEGHALDDPGGGWRDGLAAHTALQIRYLAEAGHTGIAMAFGGGEEARSGAGLAGVRLGFAQETARSLGLPAIREITLPADRAASAETLRAFMEAEPEVTAVAALDDSVGVRVLAALGDLGVPVPDRIAVIGFDDNGYGALSTPPLTTVAIDAAAHGRRAARRALGLDSSVVDPSPGRIVARGSAERAESLAASPSPPAT
jgi:DNA-binding LacI/PurR family transcriptional regulator